MGPEDPKTVTGLVLGEQVELPGEFVPQLRQEIRKSGTVLPGMLILLCQWELPHRHQPVLPAAASIQQKLPAPGHRKRPLRLAEIERDQGRRTI